MLFIAKWRGAPKMLGEQVENLGEFLANSPQVFFVSGSVYGKRRSRLRLIDRLPSIFD